MNAVVKADDLAQALRLAERVTPRTTPISILKCVLISASDGRLTVQATDLDMWLSAECECSGDLEPMAVAVEPMVNAAKRMPSDAEVRLESVDTSIRLGSGRSRHTFNTLPKDNWPAPEHRDGTWFDMPVSDLRRLLTLPAPTISKEQAKWFVRGIHWHIIDGQLRSVATNGFTFIKTETGAPEGANFKPATILETAVQFVPSLLPKDGTARVSITNDRFIVATDSATLISKLVNARFPDYQHAIPTDYAIKVEAAASELLDAIEQVTTAKDFADLAMRIRPDQATLAAGTPVTGLSRTEISLSAERTGNGSGEADRAFGEQGYYDLAFQGRYMRNVVSAVSGKGDDVTLGLNETGSAVKVVGPHGDGVVMPLRRTPWAGLQMQEPA